MVLADKGKSFLADFRKAASPLRLILSQELLSEMEADLHARPKKTLLAKQYGESRLASMSHQEYAASVQPIEAVNVAATRFHEDVICKQLLDWRLQCIATNAQDMAHLPCEQTLRAISHARYVVKHNNLIIIHCNDKNKSNKKNEQ